MSTVEKIAVTILGVIVVYLVFNSAYAGNVISSIGSNAGGLVGALQGRNVQFGGGVQVSGGPLAGPGY